MVQVITIDTDSHGATIVMTNNLSMWVFFFKNFGISQSLENPEKNIISCIFSPFISNIFENIGLMIKMNATEFVSNAFSFQNM